VVLLLSLSRLNEFDQSLLVRHSNQADYSYRAPASPRDPPLPTEVFPRVFSDEINASVVRNLPGFLAHRQR